MRSSIRFALAAAATLMAAEAHATEIDVAAYNPSFGNMGTPVTVSLGPGTYSITYGYTGAAGQFQGWDLAAANFGAWNQAPAISGCDSGGANCSYGWLDSFGYTINGAAGAAGSVIYTGPTATTHATGSGEAFATTAAALTSYAAALPYTSFTLTGTSNVTFFVPDFSYNIDNSGGVTLEVNAVPEPSLIAIVALGIGCVAFFLYRRRAS